MQRRGHHPVPNRLYDLDHSGDACRALRMADVRLDRADQQWPRRRVSFAVCCLQRFRFDRITDPRARAMRLDHVDVTRSQARIQQSLPNHPLLRWTARGGQHIGGSVLSEGAAPDQRKHRVTECYARATVWPAPAHRRPRQHRTRPPPQRMAWIGRLRTARPAGRGRCRRWVSTSRLHRPPPPSHIHPTATIAWRDAPQPEMTSSRCRPSPPGPAAQVCRPLDPTRR